MRESACPIGINLTAAMVFRRIAAEASRPPSTLRARGGLVVVRYWSHEQARPPVGWCDSARAGSSLAQACWAESTSRRDAPSVLREPKGKSSVSIPNNNTCPTRDEISIRILPAVALPALVTLVIRRELHDDTRSVALVSLARRGVPPRVARAGRRVRTEPAARDQAEDCLAALNAPEHPAARLSSSSAHLPLLIPPVIAPRGRSDWLAVVADPFLSQHAASLPRLPHQTSCRRKRASSRSLTHLKRTPKTLL